LRRGACVLKHARRDSRLCLQPEKRFRDFTLYKRWHLIGLEVGLSVASVALRGEPTGVATGWNADVVATAKRDLKPGELLDGEGGYTVWGKLLPAATSQSIGGLPLGLAHDVKVVRPVKMGQSLSWADVAMDTTTHAWRTRKAMEDLFSSPERKAA
jgi:predicted homoserine dehydrogenase-like protein